MIIEICPKCGGELMNIVLTTYPTIPKKVCTACGWSWTEEREKDIYIPFNDKEGQ